LLLRVFLFLGLSRKISAQKNSTAKETAAIKIADALDFQQFVLK
jgi:hypothetical protein